MPSKSREYFEDMRRVFYIDESPEGLYPTVGVTEALVGQVVVVVPIQEFLRLLEAWKKDNPKMVEGYKKFIKPR